MTAIGFFVFRNRRQSRLKIKIIILEDADMQTKGKNSNKKLAVAALVLLVVLTLAFGGYTLAKYLTSASGSGTAQVAKWGYTVDVDATKLFGTKYAFDTSSSKVTDSDVSLTVSASSTNNVVAPGTSGSMTIKVSGNAEVKAKLTIEVADTFKDVALTLEKDGAEVTYNPVKWTLNDGTKDLVTNGTLAQIEGALNEETTFEANAEDDVDKTYTLSWAWAFEGTSNVDDVTADELDTALGQLANGTNVSKVGAYNVKSYVTEISFDVTILVAQLAK